MSARGAHPVLLLVDDEAHILSALCRSLRREGYEILTARTPLEALAVLDARPVDAVLSDHKMPGKSGLEFLEEAVRVRPGIAAALLTGWPEEIPTADLARVGVSAIIPKPWEDKELKLVLRRMLEG